MRFKAFSTVFFSALFLIQGITAPPAQAALPLEQIKLPDKFKLEIFAQDLPGARSMAWGKNGTLFVGTRDVGNVYAIDKSGKHYTIAKKLNMPNGVAFRDGALYVAEINRILRFDGIEDHLGQPPTPIVLKQSYPSDTHHGWKFIAFGPDGKLYVPQGAPCNICDPKDPYASITRLSADGKTRDIFARGIRNSVGFDWHPTTGELWFTDNGRDWLGDDLPPDELNRAPRAGMHFGYPYCHAGETLDPDFGKGKKCADYTAPERKLGAHVAALGMRFYTGGMFPAAYRNQIFIAEHGSWNRSTPSGYRLSLVKLGPDGHAASYETFAEGWLHEGSPWGRPVDVLVAPDGALLVSDDKADAIYRISYRAK